MLSQTFTLLSVAAAVCGRPTGLGRFAQVVDRDTAATTQYDFIIAGGGIGGLTVADRLTENSKWQVLVIEAGPFDQGEPYVLQPGSYFPVPYLWPNLNSVPQTGLNNQVFGVPMGKVVGGGSVVNAMFFQRAQQEDYNSWAQLGATGLDFNSLLPYFKKSETFTPPDPAFAKARNISFDASVHGTSGPVQCSYSNYDYPSSANFWTGALSLGIKAVKESNSGVSAGIFWLLRSLDPRTETRSTARINHYDRVSTSRPNYHILASTTVSRVLTKNSKVIGVEFIASDGTKSNATAKKEVILAAGAVHTPQILQLSGIGPKALLQQYNVPVIVDLPGVGANLQDHLVLKVEYNYTNAIYPNAGTFANNKTYNDEQLALYQAGKPSAYTLVYTTGNQFVLLPFKQTTGSFTGYSNTISAAQAASPASALNTANPDPSVLTGYTAQRKILLSQWQSDTASIGSISWSTGPETTIYMMKPFSRGSVLIGSSDPLANPLVDWNAVKDPADMDGVLALYKKNSDIMNTPWVKSLGPIETTPAGSAKTDADLKAAFRTTLEPTNAHVCCTAAMMPKTQGGVVDTKFQVYGVSGLRVVDASIWPMVVAAGPQASVYGIGEKAADVIKSNYS